MPERDPSPVGHLARPGTWRWLKMFGVVALSPAVGVLYWRATRDAPLRSIAVLPLLNTTQDPATDYLSDGIGEEIINTPP
jgi:hypothetical protein